MIAAIALLALGTFLLRLLPWRGGAALPARQAGPALVVALLAVATVSPPAGISWLIAALSLGGVYLAMRAFGNPGVAVLCGMGLYALLAALLGV